MENKELKQRDVISQLFKDYLHNKYAYVRINGLWIEGSMEGRVLMKVDNIDNVFVGLDFFVPLKWSKFISKNSNNKGFEKIEEWRKLYFTDDFQKELKEFKERNPNFPQIGKYALPDYIDLFMKELIIPSYIKAGHLYNHNISSHKCIYSDEGNLKSVEINFKTSDNSESTIRITHISEKL